jgi:HEPN domain-containing protein
MSGPDPELQSERRREAARWCAVASEDARVARVCLEMPQPAPGIAAYHCQQAAEKLTKGRLILAGAAFRRPHDLTELSGLAATYDPDLRPWLESTASLTIWSTAYRYPGIEELAEPEPDAGSLQSALSTIGQLATQMEKLISANGEGDAAGGISPEAPSA